MKRGRATLRDRATCNIILSMGVRYVNVTVCVQTYERHAKKAILLSGCFLWASGCDVHVFFGFWLLSEVARKRLSFGGAGSPV